MSALMSRTLYSRLTSSLRFARRFSSGTGTSEDAGGLSSGTLLGKEGGGGGTAPTTQTRRGKGNQRSQSYERIPPVEKDNDIVASEILAAALNHVNTKGWNEDAIRAGARDVYMAEEISGIFREYDLVKFLFETCNSQLENHLSATQTTPNVLEALEYRLEKVIPYAPRFDEALALATKPANVGESLRLLLHLADSVVHHSMKDKSTDVNWYTKRMGVASIYVASELCLVQDKSENYKETFDFLSRRVKDFENTGNGNISSSVPLPELMSAGFTTLRNILRNNARR